jgi:hypothetical protein
MLVSQGFADGKPGKGLQCAIRQIPVLQEAGILYTRGVMFKPVIIPLLLALLHPFVSEAGAFEMVVQPQRLLPGDPFVVMVTTGRVAPAGLEAELLGTGAAGLNFTGCGRGCYMAVGAVALSAGPGEMEITVINGAERKSRGLKVVEGEFPTQHLTLPEEQVTLGPGDQARVDREAKELSAIWSRVTERLWEESFIMPLDGGLSTRFGTRRIINSNKRSAHRGVDIKGMMGEPVKASNRGLVVYIGDTFFGGNTVLVDHGQGIYTVYMHMSKVNVIKRELVSRGDVIGLVGSTGRSTGPHLHFGVKVGGVSASPVSMTRLPLAPQRKASLSH